MWLWCQRGQRNSRQRPCKRSLEHSQLILHVDNRDKGDVTSLQIIRAWIERVAWEVPKGSAEWETSKGIFLQKNPLEASFFTQLRWLPEGCLRTYSRVLGLHIAPEPFD